MALSRIFVAPKNGQGGVKKSKKIFFRKNIRKMGKKIWGPLGPYLPKIGFGGHVPDADPYPPRTVPRLPPKCSQTLIQASGGNLVRH